MRSHRDRSPPLAAAAVPLRRRGPAAPCPRTRRRRRILVLAANLFHGEVTAGLGMIARRSTPYVVAQRLRADAGEQTRRREPGCAPRDVIIGMIIPRRFDAHVVDRIDDDHREGPAAVSSVVVHHRPAELNNSDSHAHAHAPIASKPRGSAGRPVKIFGGLRHGDRGLAWRDDHESHMS